jgi:hypothetical protein
MTTRSYETLGRRILAILEVGGPRKPRILKALASTERQFDRTISRLKAAGLIVHHRHRGGGVYALAKKTT